MSSGRALVAFALVSGVVVLAWWLWPSGLVLPPPAIPPVPLERTPAEALPPVPGTTLPAAPAEPTEFSPAEPHSEPEPEADVEAEPAAEPSGDLRLYVDKPMSDVPHRVVTAWGATGDDARLGLVGAFVIVAPGISDAKLKRLAQDIRRYHRSAASASVQILDSEQAATYDQHVDGGALKERHLVARINLDPSLGVDEIHVRGKRVTP